NLSQFGSSLGISHTTVKKYIDLLSATFMINILPAYSGNAKKRLVKSSKVYIRDTGILHALLNIESIDQLYGHPVIGVSWETFVIENVLAVSKNINYSFYRTTNGAEIDLIIEKGIDSYAIECKFSSAPKLTPSFFEGIKELGVKHAFVVAPVDEEYLIKENITVIPLQKLIEKIANI
ncbi:MAG: DUF4143 domain-containing protein, partial [Bacteroidetes bacterium]|nr:DUF4143 domain-containing protein [Bacteroidota bacterium]